MRSGQYRVKITRERSRHATPARAADSPTLRHAGEGGPLRRALIAGGIAVYVLLALTGLLLTRVLKGSGLTSTDRGVSRWFYHDRTPMLDEVTHVGSMLSDTLTAIVVTAVLVVVLRFWLGRWLEPMVVLTCILGELFIFLLVTTTVHRRRPTVPHLDPARPTSSFPSGHTGAAVALYVGVAVVLVHVVGRRSWASVVAVPLACIPIVVGVSRLYRRMHFLTDVMAGAIAGGLWMVIVVNVLLLGRAAGER
jgi:undecaprenyl-diphosphatase